MSRAQIAPPPFIAQHAPAQAPIGGFQAYSPTPVLPMQPAPLPMPVQSYMPVNPPVYVQAGPMMPYQHTPVTQQAYAPQAPMHVQTMPQAAPSTMPQAPMGPVPVFHTPEQARAQFEAMTLSNSHAEMRDRAKEGPKRKIERRDEQLFVREYIATGRNLDLAMKRIGLPPELGDKFIMRKRVQEDLKNWAAIGLTAQDVTADRVLLALGQIAFADRRKTWDSERNDGRGGQVPMRELPEDLAASIDSIGPNGNYKLASKSDALGKLCAIFGMTKPAQTVVNVTQNNTQTNNTVNNTLQMMPEQALIKMLGMKTAAPSAELEAAVVDVDFEEAY